MNIHGAVKPSAADTSSFTLKNVDTTLCGKVYSEGPLALSAITPPTGATPIEQWHGRHGLTTPLTNATFAASMSVDCTAPPPTPVRKPGRQLDGHRSDLDRHL